uniref:Kelch like family member 10 n=1 Tax=Neogobius melanostomus TaxID=47308 RepID=A0A8C6S5G7_9GOBI
MQLHSNRASHQVLVELHFRLHTMSASISMFEEMRREQKLCDALLNVAGAQYQVHKLVLCGCSSYFRALFTHWSSPDTVVFDIPHVSADIMKIILEYIYTGVASITQENLQELFMAADLFDVSGITQACCLAIEEQLTPQNCITIWWFTSTYHYPELRSKAFHYILERFEEVSASSDDFLRLSAEDLGEIIENNHLNVIQESTVFEAVLRWIKHAPEQRQRHLDKLLSKIRLALIHPEYLKQNVLGSELVQQNRKCKDLMLTSMKFMLDARTTGFNSTMFPISLARPRLPRAALMAIGGWSSGGPTNCIETFDNHANGWVGVANDDETPRAYHGTVFLNGSVYVIGGFDGRSQFCTTHRYDLARGKWQEVANMHSRRCYVSVALLDGLIYALGGYDGDERLDTAERYAPDANQWTMIAPMIETRSDASSTAHNGKVCMFQLSAYATITSGTVQLGSQRFDGVGGFSGMSRLRSVEAYDQETNTWRPMPSMLNKRSNFGIEVMDERLYVVGGFSGTSTINSVECWDVKTRAWSSVRDMNIYRSALGCSVVFDLPNIFLNLPYDRKSLLFCISMLIPIWVLEC